MLKRILVGLGGTSYTSVAIQHAIELARRHDAEVTGVTILNTSKLGDVGPVPIGGGGYARELREHRVTVAHEHVAAATSEFETACQQANVRHRVLHEEGDPFQLMTSLSRYHDLIICGLRSLFEFDVVSDPHDVLVRLIADGVRPLLAVNDQYKPVERVLITYSGSVESAKTMKRFVQMQLWPNLTVRIVHFSHGGTDENLTVEAAAYCRAHGLDAEPAIVQGSATDDLLAYAGSYGADLIVAGNSARNLLLRRVFGETVLNLIRTSDRPLFLSQ